MIFHQHGRGDALRAMVNHTTMSNLVLGLFSNNITPAETDAAAAFTAATFTGYSAITLTGSSWTVTDATPATATFADQTFTSSADSQNQDIYGFYMYRATGGRIFSSQRGTGVPFNIANNGDEISVTGIEITLATAA